MEFQGLNGQYHLEENARFCADCNQDNVSWCDMKYGCYLCIECASIHKQLADGGQHEVKSFHLDEWTDKELERASGNQESDKLEFCRPVYYLKPEPQSLYILKHEYIQDKYNRKLFTSDDISIDCYGLKSGVLFKKGKSNESWKQRYFRIQQGVIEYYLKRGDTNPKCALQLENIDVAIQPLPGKPYALAISHTSQEENTRTYHVYADTNRETIEWYYAILAAQYMQTISKSETIYEIKEHSKSGYIYKTGSKRKDKWRKRWLTVINGRAQYFEDETSSRPKGEFELETNGEFSVVDGTLGHKVTPPTVYTFTVKTPKRDYKICVSSEEDKQSWMQQFERAIKPKA